MERSELPLLIRCMENAQAFETNGDPINAEKWLLLGEKAEIYYSKQNWMLAEDYYHIYDDFKEK